MTKLNQAQTHLLTLAADAGDAGLEAQPEMRATSAALIKRGLLISLPKPNEPSRLLATTAGLVEIGREAEAQAPAKPKAKAAEAPVSKEPLQASKPAGKIDMLVELLGQPGGATIEAMMTATGWQAHSVRGAIAGTVKKARGLQVVSAKVEGQRVYRITREQAAAVA